MVVCSEQAGLVYRGVCLANASPVTIEQVEVVGQDYVVTNSIGRERLGVSKLTISPGSSIVT